MFFWEQIYNFLPISPRGYRFDTNVIHNAGSGRNAPVVAENTVGQMRGEDKNGRVAVVQIGQAFVEATFDASCTQCNSFDPRRIGTIAKGTIEQGKMIRKAYAVAGLYIASLAMPDNLVAQPRFGSD